MTTRDRGMRRIQLEIPESWYDVIDTYCGKRGIDQTTLLRSWIQRQLQGLAADTLLEMEVDDER